MNRGPLIFVGVLFAMATSWSGLVFAPYLQLAHQQPTAPVGVNMPFYPVNPDGLSHQGAEVYRSLGCVQCHSQVIRGTPGDLQRWGVRRTVAADYLYDDPPQIGSQRVGADLSNIGTRQPDAQWHYAHLYQPRSRVEKSVMPPYPFLFVEQKIQGTPSPKALQLSGPYAPREGYEIVPTHEAEALVGYLLSRKVNIPLFEAPIPVSKKKAEEAKPAETNATAAPTKS